MSALTIRLLGPPHIECDGAALEVDTRKAVALLAYLAVSGQAHARESLAGLLWPDLALGGRWVVADRRTVRLERQAVTVDVERFHALLAAAAREPDPAARRACRTEAAALHRGDFLAGFALRDSPEFDDWQFFTAEALRPDLGEALEALVQDCAAVGDLRGALTHAHRWVALDPLHESAHRDVMTLYACNGQRGAALRQYRECVKVLDRELGVAVTGLLLAGLSGEPPGLLVIDDVHWADSASLALLTYLARRLPGAPVGITLAWRSEAVPPDDHLRRLAADTSCPTTRLMLDRLARPEVDRLIDAREPHFDEATRARLWEETEGVPLFVVEYLAAIGAGADVDEWTVSSGVRDLVSTRPDPSTRRPGSCSPPPR